jgi:eukaryotic-like serine/threonine-protein kinase
MSLPVGTRLGPYEITGSLGAGGMGEVYRAHDTELGREVALKVLPADFQADADRLARFQREAQVLASLNHQAIAAIHGLERSGGVPALVLELVEGETLADRLVHGPLPLDETTQIAKQIADALEVAHDRGIVHRDLKPANVKVRPDGTVKVLDFGLAKAIEPEGAGRTSARVSSSMSPTIISPAMTQAGFILGTAAYMAPEQAKGRDVDQRADIWAFGCVVYEMLTGRRAFPGDDVTDTLAAVVLRDPDWSALPASTPAGIRRLLMRSLRKDPRQRLRHIADARQELEESEREPVAVPSPQITASAYRRLALEIVGALVLVAAAVWLTTRASRVVESGSPIRFSVAPPPDVQVPDEGDPLARFSPDGRRLVLTYRTGSGEAQLFTRSLEENEVKPIAGTEGGRAPFFSPDGKWIGYVTGRTLKKVAVDGGASVPIADSFSSGAWAPDDTIVYTPNYTSGLWRVSSSGGTPRKLTDPTTAEGELGHFWPQVLPDGKHVLFTSFRTPAERSRIEVYSLENGTRAVVMDGGFSGQYVQSGHLLFARSTTVMAVRFDPDRLTTIGQPVPVIAGVAVTLPNGLAQFNVSNNGTLAYVTQTALASPRQLAWLDRSGKASPIGDARRRFEDPRISPDGRLVALTIRDENDADIWTYDLTRGTFSRITSSPTTQFRPIWSPDSRRLYFVFEEPVFHIYSHAVDGAAAEPTRVLDGPYDMIPNGVSPDGELLLYHRNDPKTRGGIWALPLKGGSAPRVVIDTPADELTGLVSPDGRWLAYRSNETGRHEIYVQAFPGGGNRIQVSLNGGEDPEWSRDSRSLFFRQGEKMMFVPFEGSTFGRPSLLFTAPLVGYDVAADGRLLAVLRDSTVPQAPVNVVVNWFDELKRLVPAD